MHCSAHHKSTYKSVLVVSIIAAGLTAARADVIEPNATLPPPTGVYTLPLICIPAVCVANTRIFGFHNTSDQLVGGNEQVVTTAIFAGDVYQNNVGTPGAFLGALAAPGTLDITYFGRNFTTPLGTFNAEITDFMFAGSLNGHTFESMRNPSQTSSGQTTITQLPGGEYRVSSFFDVFSELSIDGRPFVPEPERVEVLTGEIPEPGTATFGFLGAGGLCLLRFRRSRR